MSLKLRLKGILLRCIAGEAKSKAWIATHFLHEQINQFPVVVVLLPDHPPLKDLLLDWRPLGHETDSLPVVVNIEKTEVLQAFALNGLLFRASSEIFGEIDLPEVNQIRASGSFWLTDSIYCRLSQTHTAKFKIFRSDE